MRNFISGNPNRTQFVPPAPDYVDARVMAATTAERHAIPVGAKLVVFSATGDFYAKFGNSSVDAAVPAADVTDGTGSELNPEAREIAGDATHVSVIAPVITTITMSFYGK